MRSDFLRELGLRQPPFGSQPVDFFGNHKMQFSIRNHIIEFRIGINKAPKERSEVGCIVVRLHCVHITRQRWLCGF